MHGESIQRWIESITNVFSHLFFLTRKKNYYSRLEKCLIYATFMPRHNQIRLKQLNSKMDTIKENYLTAARGAIF